MENTAQMIQELQDLCARQAQMIETLTAKVNWYEEQYRLSQQRRFGRKSEAGEGQLCIFNEPEKEADPKAEEPTIEVATHQRKKRGKNREDLKNLPTETIHYRLDEVGLNCETCGSGLHEMSTETRRELEIIPAQVKVIEHVRHVYACRACETEGTGTEIITAQMPKPAFPGSIASAGTVAHIISQKYVEGLPLYRQEKSLERLGISISRQNMANWMIRAAENWFNPLYERFKVHLLSQKVLHSDETELQVLKEDGRTAANKSYLWLYHSGRDGPPLAIFDYQTTRASKHPIRFLTGFEGYLHVDGYAGYNSIPDVILVGCWAHARRKFDEALKALPADQKKVDVPAKEALKQINALFMLERDFKALSIEERYAKRLELSRPLVDQFYEWLAFQRPRVLPKSAFGEAITYCFNQKEKLYGFLLDGRLEFDNNRAERSIKPYVIGRKNWLFANTARGATASAILYSMVETAKENDLSPYAYLKYLLEQLPNIDLSNVAELDLLMPWSDELPPVCRGGKPGNQA
jgi:transposase